MSKPLLANCGKSLHKFGVFGHQLSLEHDVTQPAPTVTSQSERYRKMKKNSQNRLSRTPGPYQ